MTAAAPAWVPCTKTPTETQCAQLQQDAASIIGLPHRACSMKPLSMMKRKQHMDDKDGKESKDTSQADSGNVPGGNGWTTRAETPDNVGDDDDSGNDDGYDDDNGYVDYDDYAADYGYGYEDNDDDNDYDDYYR